MTRIAHVTRTVIIKYDVPTEFYPGMTDEDIISYENSDGIDAASYLDDIDSDVAVVTFTEEA
jgi:hypothetical protein